MEYNFDADYRQMYIKLFNAVTDAIAQLEQQNYGIAANLLKNAQAESDIPIRKHKYPTTHCKVCCRVHFCLFLQKKCCCKEKTRCTTLCNASVADAAAAFLC